MGVALAVACALRLARFNVMLDDPTQPAWHAHFFTGMPAPAGAILAMLPMYLALAGVEIVTERVAQPFVIAYVLMVAFLMASRIPHFSGKKIGRVPREYVIVVLFGVAVCMLLIATYTMVMMAVLSLLYLALVPLAGRRYNAYVAQDAAVAAGLDTASPPPATDLAAWSPDCDHSGPAGFFPDGVRSARRRGPQSGRNQRIQMSKEELLEFPGVVSELLPN
eukprot:gene38988-47313_t